MDDIQILNDEENNNIDDNILENNRQNKICLGLIILISIFIVFFNCYQIYYLINLIKKAYNILPREQFEECYLYHSFSDLLLEFYSFFLGLDLLFLCFLPFFNINFEVFTDKFSSIFYYLNYLIFGPFTIGLLFLCLSHANKLMYVCVNYKTDKKIFNFKLIFMIFFSVSFSLLVTLVGILYFNEIYFVESIKFESGGNYLFGYFFWKFGLNRSRRFRNRNNQMLDNNNNNNLILLDEQIDFADL